MTRYIQFKTKAYQVNQGDGTERTAINWKVKLVKTDCNLRPCDHAYYNSDLFTSILNRAYRRMIGQYSEFVYIDALPAGVTVDTTKFLAVVRVALPEGDFKG